MASALYLLHHLVFPSPLKCRPRTHKSEASSQRHPSATLLNRDVATHAPQGVDLQARLLSASAVKEWSGLQHMFVSALGSLAYCEFVGRGVMDDNGESNVEVEWRTLQCKSTLYSILTASAHIADGSRHQSRSARVGGRGSRSG